LNEDLQPQVPDRVWTPPEPLETLPPDAPIHPGLPLEKQKQDPPWTILDVLILALSVPLTLVVPMVIFGILGYLSGFKAMPDLKSPTGMAMALGLQVICYVLLALVLALLLRVRHQLGLGEAMKIRLPDSGLSGLLKSAAIGPVMAIVLGGLGSVLMGDKKPPNPFVDLLGGGPRLLAAFLLFAVIVGPFFEELFFRGFLQPWLRRLLGVPAAILLSGVPFAMMHGPQYEWMWQAMLILLLASAVFAWLRHSTNSLLTCFVAHATYNATLMSDYLLFKDKF
jgi:membrane protease YdiL (CAAX protease family)